MICILGFEFFSDYILCPRLLILLRRSLPMPPRSRATIWPPPVASPVEVVKVMEKIKAFKAPTASSTSRGWTRASLEPVWKRLPKGREEVMSRSDHRQVLVSKFFVLAPSDTLLFGTWYTYSHDLLSNSCACLLIISLIISAQPRLCWSVSCFGYQNQQYETYASRQFKRILW
jgi:hypothetical protein